MDIQQLGSAAAVVIVVSFFLKYIGDSDKRRDISHEKLALAIDENTKVTQQTYEYLKMRNGRLDEELRRMNDKMAGSDAVIYEATKIMNKHLKEKKNA